MRSFFAFLRCVGSPSTHSFTCSPKAPVQGSLARHQYCAHVGVTHARSHLEVRQHAAPVHIPERGRLLLPLLERRVRPLHPMAALHSFGWHAPLTAACLGRAAPPACRARRRRSTRSGSRCLPAPCRSPASAPCSPAHATAHPSCAQHCACMHATLRLACKMGSLCGSNISLYLR